MAKAKGSIKTGGRSAGTPNKITSTLKERWLEFVEGNFDQVQGWFDMAVRDNPTEGLKLYLQFSERIIPKVSSQSLDVTSQGQQIQAPTIIVNGTITD